jgi:hypothetical protein
MKKALLLCSLIIIIACDKKQPQTTTEAVAKTEISTVNDDFQRFLDQFPEIALPLEIKGCDARTDLKTVNTAISSPFIKEEGSYVYGKFAFGDKYTGVITLHAADCFIPHLAVYNLNGKLIDSKPLAIGQCSDGPCYKCEEVLQIDQRLSIYVADTLQAFECDEDDLPKGAAVTTTIIYKEGKITPAGRIAINKEQTKQL